ncbi:putative reverse transcriptase domain-containing protein, partial [Tanacetum coccineum]
ATTVNPVGRENTGTWPKCTTYNSYHAPVGPCRICFNCNRPGHLARDCRSVPRNVNPVNARNPNVRACFECGSTDHVRSAYPRWNRAQGPGENRPNQVVVNNGGQGRGNQGKQARGRAFMLGAEEARQDPNIVTGTFTLNNHFATTLFDSGADYSFVSTTFIHMLGLEPNDLGFRYEIEIASGQLVEINRVIKGCKLEIEGHVFDIDLIPFGHGSFDVIIGIDWLSNYKAEIVFHDKVVRIPLPDGKVLRVVGERPEEKARFLMGVKKQEEIVVVRDFLEVFLDDLSGLPPIRKIEFPIELTPGATPVAKSPYRLAPFELEELSGQLKELQDKGFIQPSSSPWGAPCKTFDSNEEQELAFQTLKDKLCTEPVQALPDGPEDFMSSIKDRILAAQKEVVDESMGLQKGLDEMIEQRSDGTLYYLDRIWVPLKDRGDSRGVRLRAVVNEETQDMRREFWFGCLEGEKWHEGWGGRKAHLREDKQILKCRGSDKVLFRYLAFGRLLEEIRVDLGPHLEKDIRTRLTRHTTNISQEVLLRSWRRKSQSNVKQSQPQLKTTVTRVSIRHRL